MSEMVRIELLPLGKTITVEQGTPLQDVLFAQGDRGPAVEDTSMPHAGESFEGKTGTEDVSGR